MLPRLWLRCWPLAGAGPSLACGAAGSCSPWPWPSTCSAMSSRPTTRSWLGQSLTRRWATSATSRSTPLAALLRLPVTRRSPRERVTLGLDCALVALSGAVPIWYVSLGPTLAAGGQGGVAMAVSLAYPLGDMVLLVGVAALLFRGAPAGMRGAEAVSYTHLRAHETD